MINFEEEKFKAIIKKIIRKQGFSNDSQIILSSGSGKGDGYLGEIVSILVRDEISKNSLKLVAKIALKDEKLRDTFPYAEVFKNEIATYEKIFPAIVNLQIEANIPKLFNPTARFYSASTIMNNEYLIMEDLRISRYEMLGMRELLDHEHTETICETYGKLHGLSFALKILQNEKFREVTSELTDVMGILFREKKLRFMFPKTWHYVRNVMRERGIENEHLNNYVENSLVIMRETCDLKEEQFSCFLHGDCWTNNIMFRHKDNKNHQEVEGIKLLDWQACRIGLPVCDLSYTLYSGGSKEVLANLETYMKIYHKSLSNTLSQFHLDVNSVYPFVEMKKEWKKYYHFGVILSGPIWKFRSFNENQGVDPLNYTSDGDSTYLDAIAEAECDKDYLFEHMKYLLDHLDGIAEGNILN